MTNAEQQYVPIPKTPVKTPLQELIDELQQQHADILARIEQLERRHNESL